MLVSAALLMRCNVKWNSQWNSPGLPVIFRPSAATLESSGCTHRFESNIYATECMGSSAHKSIHSLEYLLALSYQILPANDEVCAEHGRHACLPKKEGTQNYASYQLHLTINAYSSPGGKGRPQAGAPGSSSHYTGFLASPLPCWTWKAWY